MKNKAMRFPTIALCAVASAAFITAPLHAETPRPNNLASGLDELVASNIAMRSAQARGKRVETPYVSSKGQYFATARAAEYAGDATTDDSGRYLVRAHLNGFKDIDAVLAAIKERVPSFESVAVDRRYRGGVINAYVSLDDVAALANTGGVQTVALESQMNVDKAAVSEAKSVRPEPNVVPGQAITTLGTTYDQGVYMHRVDQINKYYNPAAALDYQGTGIQIGFISDSYNGLSSATVRASGDVTNFDLPGAAGNPAGNTQPVVVLQDTTGTDEGRGMGQIVYKMAPKARIAFATAAGGEANFAHNIRALAALPSDVYPAGTQQGFKADVICDDISYGTMPFFEDGIVGLAVDDVTAAGVSYASSAGNDIGTYDTDQDFRLVANGNGLTAATNAALAGTNINLTGVPANLYAGGFHNFRSDGGLDVAQTVNVITVAAGLPQTNLQWDDPYNQLVYVVTPAIYHNSGNHPGSGQQIYTVPNTLTAGTRYTVVVAATGGSSFDAIVTVRDPSNNLVAGPQDTGTDEVVQFLAPVTGSGYRIVVESFGGTTGTYDVDLYLSSSSGVQNDINLLVFRADTGAYISGSSLTTNNVSSNVPQEFGRTAPPTGQTQVQYVITRGGNSIGNTPPTHFRWIIRGNGLSGIGPAEYIVINTPNAGLGHRLAKGCITTAAYPAFRPSMPEYFTSPGPATVYFDITGNRLPTPDIRLKPVISAMDSGNTSFFPNSTTVPNPNDSASDFDTKPNFGGTSAAAPHAIAVAALVLQAHGGPGSVTPAQMQTILKNSAFQHDLDPNFASGSARTSNGGKVTISIAADRGLNPSSGAFNPDSISVSYVGPGNLTSLSFNPNGLAAEGGAPTAGNNGLANAAETADGNIYFDHIYPGVIFQPLPAGGTRSGNFILGNSVGLTAADVTFAFANPAPPPSTATQFWTANLTFPTGAFTGGKVLRFSTGHAQQHDSTVTAAGGTGPTGGVTGVNSTQADQFGGAVLYPQGTVLSQGMTFSGTTSGGGTFTGQIVNRLGKGYSVTTGFGFINAEAAVTAPLP